MPTLKELLGKLELDSPLDLALHLPYRYEDLTQLTDLSQLQVGQVVQVEGVVLSCQVQFRPKRQLLAQISLADGTSLQVRLLHFYPYQQKQLTVENIVRLHGELRLAFPLQAGRLEMIHPTIQVCTQWGQRQTHQPEQSVAQERLSAAERLPEHLTPVYPTTAGLSQFRLRQAIAHSLPQVLPDLPDTLPPQIRESLQLWPLNQALQTLHAPPVGSDLVSLERRTHPAWVRIKFDELLAQQLSLQLARATRVALAAPRLPPDALLRKQLLAQLPFELTGAQQRVVDEIAHDLAQPTPMARLLQGDVGSGKTVVAALAAVQAVAAGYQCVMLAPTEILAEQHWQKLQGWLRPLGINMASLIARASKRDKQEIVQALARGDCQFVVGTHALIQAEVSFANLGLAIIDEQHRFGVAQRMHLLQTPNGQRVHQLMMSATPIPRTLAMTFYADLDISTIDELPPGRQAITTKLIEQGRRPQVFASIRAEVQAGRQVYWVCPLIEESEHVQLQTAIQTHQQLQQSLPELRIGLLHGRLKVQEKASIMEAFVAGDLDILVATTVIEVGVDVPNASLMIIEHAERFGLAQLHQLRGRVGRGRHASVCVLLYEAPLGEAAKARLRTMYATQDGFVIAQRDLEIRGPGEFLGLRQAGMPLLRYADLEQDQNLITLTRTVATTMLVEHPAAVQHHLERWLPNRDKLLCA